MTRFLNIHTHTFTFNHVPLRFIPMMDTALWISKTCPHLTDLILPERASVFMKRGQNINQSDILIELADYYPTNTCFAIHSMDFEYMGAGPCRKGYDFIVQIDELADLKASEPLKDRIFPFICVDPRRKDIVKLAKLYIETKGFAGIKLYPPLGYFPDDERLQPLWAWAEAENIPIMTHCSRSGPVYGRNAPLFIRPKIWANRYTNPVNYIPIFQRHPNIKICFAHFGGENDCMNYYKTGDYLQDNWFIIICQLLKQYKGAFADISYTTGNADIMALFHVYAQGKSETGYSLSDKILFGSDYYMAHLTRNERWFSINVRSCMGEETFWKLIDNSWNYLLSK